ncbi:hypothetical protein NP511_22260 (plasmid) [Natrinema thermotolerans]|uniref:NrS-1 polymerase-like HBD domain-containing protein n=1 Tax=Natrinema thermotolerans TaxID=121872 RepID=A0AAF0T145_9EURY|nr:hypothetical protein [Natrinema thermotolerans]QCC57183.1 hypothetical protein DVR14_00355 [Natrinema thermotolerans]WMT10321.1 hypothetical protein NP511_22260 [Natrinema thermotolerans]
MKEKQTHSIDTSGIPETLQEYDQWICWRVKERDGKATKVPIVPGTGEYASATDPQTWRPFDEALEYFERGEAAGVGFVFTDDDPFVGIDLDDCRDPETESPGTDAREIILELESFTEVSPSGTGYHVIVCGSLPGDRSRRGSVEMYETARFFTVTGDRVETTPSQVIERPAALESVYTEYIAKTEPSDSENEVRDQQASTHETSQSVTLEDEELLKRARNASNGEKFKRLWRGSTAGYESQSEADMALCFLLAFWTGGDAARVDQLFRQSGLLRDKWDEVHYADGSTYGEKTVERAIANTDDVYDPSSSEASRGKQTKKRGQTTIQEPAQDGQSSTTEQTLGGTEGTRAAYLAEKNQLLTDRVDELEATLEQKNERIDRLEATNRTLRDQLTTCEKRLEMHDQRSERETDVDSSPDHDSLWTRTKQFVGRRKE